MTEKQWVKSLVPLFEEILEVELQKVGSFAVLAPKKLPYSFCVLSYGTDDKPVSRKSSYETDLLIIENLSGGSWAPCVAIEFKLGSVTTHDALTYNCKAVSHKHVHPYLKYGFVVGRFGKRSLPGRLIKHGGDFDFIAKWAAERPIGEEFKCLSQVILDSVVDSRHQRAMLESRSFHDGSGCYFVSRDRTISLTL